MKPIIINENNANRIDEAIEAVQKRASVRRINGYNELCAVICEVESQLKISMKAMDGCEIVIDNATCLAKAYKYQLSAQATGCRLIYHNRSWRLVDVWRGTVPNRQTRLYYHTIITPAARDAIIDRMDLTVKEAERREKK